LQEYLWDVGVPNQPTEYTSIYSPNYLFSISQKIIHDLMYDITASNVSGSCSSTSDCESGNECIRQICMESNTHFHEAYSLAFELNYIDGLWSIVDPTKSTWTESVWDALSVQIFKMDSPITEVVVFIFGILNVLLSIGAVWFLQKYFTKRFKAS